MNIGTYCYKVKPFNLKNVGATYQRMVTKMVKRLISRNLEVYVDDMLVKSLSFKQHMKELEKVIRVPKKYQMKLNITKCMFSM